MMQKKFKKHSLKFLSLGLSLFLWAYVLNSEKIKFEKTVQLDYILPEEMIFASKPPQEITFMIDGPRAFVRTLLERDDRLMIDLNKINSKRELNFQYETQNLQLTLPFGMAVERIVPRKINISLEKRASKILPVKPMFAGVLPDKMNFGQQEFVPAEVEVYGPRSVLSKMKEITTKPLELEALVGSDSIAVEIFLPDERLSLVSGQNILFKYQLKAKGSNIILKDLPIKFMGNIEKFTPSIRKASVKLLVPDIILKSRSNISSSIQIWADVPDSAKGKREVELKVIIPQGVHLIEIFPKSILVNIQ